MDLFDNSIFSLWAKKGENKNEFCWLPLMAHLEDTMNVSRWLWNNWLSDRQRKFCIDSLTIYGNNCDEEIASNVAAFIGAVHDIGKATPVFQIQRGFYNSNDLDKIILEKLEYSGFTGISSLELSEPKKTHHSVAGHYLLTKCFGVKDDIGSIISGHHGKPIDEKIIISDQEAYVANYFQTEKNDYDIFKKWKKVQEDIFDWALEKSGIKCTKNLPSFTQPVQVIYSGLLIMADWIASNTDYFPLFDIDKENVSDSMSRYKIGIEKWQKNLQLQMLTNCTIDDLFYRRFNYEPRDFQKKVCQISDNINEPGILILEAPMGLGKTETALILSEKIAGITGSSGLFFGLPTQATSNSMFERIHKWLRSVTDDYKISQSLRLCHGKAMLNDEMNNLIEQSPKDINIDEENNGSIFVNEWFTGRKKTSLDDFVVGTVDSFLLTALRQKHLALRHLGFSKKVIIIDEVHAYDVYMQQYLERALTWMGAYGAPVILVSATLPKDKRKDLIAAYLNGKGVKKKEITYSKEIEKDFYPLFSYSDGKTVHIENSFLNMEDKTISVKKIDENDIIEKIDRLLVDGGNIGIIVNTVRKAQKLAERFVDHFGDEMVEILHSAFIAKERINKEEKLLQMIGKNGKRPNKKIIIGTQVIEQSLDIDFDVLFSEICPIDLLIQRIGRLHRHPINRTKINQEPVIYVIGTNDNFDFDEGSKQIYGSYFLIRTQSFLPDKIMIPTDIPRLINEVYNEESIELSDELKKIYDYSKEENEINKEKCKNKAKAYILDIPKLCVNSENNNLIGWLEEPEYSISDEMAIAQVRDIKETIEIIAVKKIGDGYTTFDRDYDISSKISEYEIAKELTEHTIRLPHYLSSFDIIKKLEEYNSKFLSEWKEQHWLNGCLGIIFDENGCFEFKDIYLIYDKKLGLQEGKANGEI